MSRVSIAFPEPVVYREERTVSPAEVNQGNHLGFDQAVKLIADARRRFFHHFGLSDLDENGTGVVVADLAVRYKAEIFAGERLRIEVAAGNPSGKSCDLFYRVLKLEDHLEALVAKTGIVFFDYAARRPTPMPEAYRRRLFSGADTLPSRPPGTGQDFSPGVE
ncbi:MAG: acyl-CoA thioesterase [Desulfobacterales bacterium]